MPFETDRQPEDDFERPARPGGARSRRLAVVTSQILAVLLSLAVGWYAYTLVRDEQAAINQAIWLYLAVLLLMGYFAWDGDRPNLRTWPARISAYVRAHPVELLLLLGVVLLAAFVRLFTYGDLPPTGYIYLEEHINGGVAHRIIHGERPYAYWLNRYSTAIGMWIFGPTTLGMRFALYTLGIAAVVPFYLLLREMVERPAALFASALFACNRAVADITSHFQAPMFALLLMVWFMIRGLRTRNAIWFVPAAALGVMVSHEYEVFKGVPLFAACFLAWVTLRGAVWPIPRSQLMIRERVRGLGPFALRAAIVIAVVVPVWLGPMAAQKGRGENIYFASLNRQQEDRESRGTPGLIADNWESQLKRSIEVFTPWVTANYNAIGPIAARGVIDRMSSLLIWAGVIGGVLFFWRGYRAMFIGWFAGGMLMSSLLLSNWAPWKLTGWLPPALVLVGFLADDALGLSERFGARAKQIVLVGMAGVIAVVFALNVRAIWQNAHDDQVLKEWGNNPSQLYSICDNLRKRPGDTFAVVSQRVRNPWGFMGNEPPETIEQQRKAWGDYLFVCSKLRGIATSNLQEMWPIVVTEERPYTLIQSASKDDVRQIRESLARAMPEVGEPDRVIEAPGGTFESVIYETTRDALNARQGLVLRWRDGQGDVMGDPEVTVSLDAVTPPAEAASYSLSGLLYLPTQIEGGLATTTGEDITTTVDNRASYAGGSANPRLMSQGWHIVEITGRTPTMGGLRLAWLGSDGSVFDVAPEDMFALEDLGVWLHLRQTQIEGEPPVLWQRYDFEPHIAGMDGARMSAASPLPRGTNILSDHYRGYVDIQPGGKTSFLLSAAAQEAEMKIDGVPVFRKAKVNGQLIVTVELTAGEHLIELTFDKPDGVAIGGVIQLLDPETEQPVAIVARPFSATGAP